MRVFLNLMSWSNDKKSSMRVDKREFISKSLHEFSILVSWSNENKSCIIGSPGTARISDVYIIIYTSLIRAVPGLPMVA